MRAPFSFRVFHHNVNYSNSLIYMNDQAQRRQRSAAELPFIHVLLNSGIILLTYCCHFLFLSVLRAEITLLYFLRNSVIRGVFRSLQKSMLLLCAPMWLAPAVTICCQSVLRIRHVLRLIVLPLNGGDEGELNSLSKTYSARQIVLSKSRVPIISHDTAIGQHYNSYVQHQ